MTSLPSWLLPSLISALIALLLAGISLIIKIVGDVAGLQKVSEAHTEVLKCVPDLMRNQDQMLYRQGLTDEIMIKQAIAQIHSPDHVERDTLTEKLRDRTLTPPEARELIWRLELMIEDDPKMDRWPISVLLVQAQAIADGRPLRAGEPICTKT